MIVGMPVEVKSGETKNVYYFSSVRKTKELIPMISKLKRLVNAEETNRNRVNSLDVWDEAVANEIDEATISNTIAIADQISNILTHSLEGAGYTKEAALEIADSIPMDQYSEIENRLLMGGGFLSLPKS